MLTTGVRTPVGIKIYGADLERSRRSAPSSSRSSRTSRAPAASMPSGWPGGYFVDFTLKREQIGPLRPDGRGGRDGDHVGRSAARTSPRRSRGGNATRVNVRYARELRDDLDSLRRVLVPTMSGAQIPLGAAGRHHAGLRPGDDPGRERHDRRLCLRGHDGPGRRRLRRRGQEGGRRPSSSFPPGYSLQWSGQYENMLRVRERLKIVIPLTLFIIFMLLYMNTKSRRQDRHRHAGRAVLADRRDLVAVSPRLQYLDRGLGRDDRPDGPRRRDRASSCCCSWTCPTMTRSGRAR